MKSAVSLTADDTSAVRSSVYIEIKYTCQVQNHVISKISTLRTQTTVCSVRGLINPVQIQDSVDNVSDVDVI
jgi:hypothetical protein